MKGPNLLCFTGHCSGEGIAVGKALQWGRHCRGEGIAVGKALQWGRHCSGEGISVGKALQWERHCSWVKASQGQSLNDKVTINFYDTPLVLAKWTDKAYSFT